RPSTQETAETARCPEPGGSRPFPRLHSQYEAASDSDDLLRRRLTDLRSHPSEAHRYRQSTHGHPCRTGQGPEGSLRDAFTQIVGDIAKLLSGRAAEGLPVRG